MTGWLSAGRPSYVLAMNRAAKIATWTAAGLIAAGLAVGAGSAVATVAAALPQQPAPSAPATTPPVVSEPTTAPFTPKSGTPTYTPTDFTPLLAAPDKTAETGISGVTDLAGAQGEWERVTASWAFSVPEGYPFPAQIRPIQGGTYYDVGLGVARAGEWWECAVELTAYDAYQAGTPPRPRTGCGRSASTGRSMFTATRWSCTSTRSSVGTPHSSETSIASAS